MIALLVTEQRMTPTKYTNRSSSPVELYHFSLPADEQAYRQLALADEEWTRASRYSHLPSRQLYAFSRRMIRLQLAAKLGLSPSELRFGQGEHGKPFLISSDEHCSKLHYNLSHSKQQIVLAVSQGREVGVDLEYIHRRNDVIRIARHYFSQRELGELNDLPLGDQKDRFFDLWTLKESYIKAVGRGLALGLANFSFSFDSCANQVERHVMLDRDAGLLDSVEHWGHRVFAFNEDYRLALTLEKDSEDEPIEVVEKTLRLEDLL